MITTTTNDVEGRAITDYVGLVRGIIVRAPTQRQRIRGGSQVLFEGGISVEYTELAEAARRDAFERMLEHAKDLGADAVVAIRYQATPFADGVTEVLVYGTAVRLVREETQHAHRHPRQI